MEGGSIALLSCEGGLHFFPALQVELFAVWVLPLLFLSSRVPTIQCFSLSYLASEKAGSLLATGDWGLPMGLLHDDHKFPEGVQEGPFFPVTLKRSFQTFTVPTLRDLV